MRAFSKPFLYLPTNIIIKSLTQGTVLTQLLWHCSHHILTYQQVFHVLPVSAREDEETEMSPLIWCFDNADKHFCSHTPQSWRGRLVTAQHIPSRLCCLVIDYGTLMQDLSSRGLTSTVVHIPERHKASFLNLGALITRYSLQKGFGTCCSSQVVRPDRIYSSIWKYMENSPVFQLENVCLNSRWVPS